MIHSKEYFMKQALKEAEKALKKLEVPVGAIIVKDNKVLLVQEAKKSAMENGTYLLGV